MAFFYIFTSLDFTSMSHEVGQADNTIVEKAETHTDLLKGNKKNQADG